MRGAPTAGEPLRAQPGPSMETDVYTDSSFQSFFAFENNGSLANMTPPEGEGLLCPSPTARSPSFRLQGPPERALQERSRKGRSSSCSVASLMSEDGEGEEDMPTLEQKEKGASRPRRAAAARSRRAAAEAAAAAAAPPPVSPKYREELRKVDADIIQIIKNKLPSTDLLSNRDAYIKAKLEMEVPEGEEEMEGEAEQPPGTGLVLRLQRLLRLLCEGSPLPLSSLAEAASKALEDEGPEGRGAPVFSVDPETLKVELPVLLTRRRFGLVRPIDNNEGASAGGPQGPPQGPLEDTSPHKLWAWECVLLDGLPATFRETARRDREARQTLNRRLRALERLREALCGGVEAEIAAARERVQQQLQREFAAAERKQQQETKRKQLEYVRKEREREKRQREAEKEKRERERQEEKEKREKEREEQRLQKLQQQAEKQKEKKADPSVNRQQSLMASWLRRPASSVSGGPQGSSLGGPRGPPSPSAPGQAEGEAGEGEIVVVLDEEEQAAIKEQQEMRSAAEAEAVAWKVVPEDREEFVSVLEGFAGCAMQRHRRVDPKNLPQLKEVSEGESNPSFLLQQFVEKYAAPARASLRAFVAFCAERRRFVHKISLQQSSGAPADSESSSSSSSSSGSGGYRQAAADVRKGLTLTDYCAESLPDAPFLRTSWVALDEWKRPVRKLLMAKQPKTATSCEQCAEESCVDYERDSDDEWFECFDADDLEDAKEEEEEEEIEGADDRDWLEEDEDAKDKFAASSVIKFESFLQWSFTFDGEAKPNEADMSLPLVAIPSLRDGHWCSAYGCVGDDWGGNPFARLDAVPTHSRRKWSDEDSINLLKFFHGKTVGKLKNIPEFQRANRHVTKAEVERQLKQCMVYERRPEDRQRRWYATEEAARAFSLVEELEGILQSIRAEEKLAEAKQQELAEQLKAQLAANNTLIDPDDRKKEQIVVAPAAAPPAAAASSAATDKAVATAPPPASQQKEKNEGIGASSVPTGNNKLHAFFAKKVEPAQQQEQLQQIKAAEEAAEGERFEQRPSGMLQQNRPSASSAGAAPWPREADAASAAAAADIAATSAAAAAAAAAQGRPQDAALAAHVAAAALLAAKLARGAAAIEDGRGSAATSCSEVEVVSVRDLNRVSPQPTPTAAWSSPSAKGGTTVAGRKSAEEGSNCPQAAPFEKPAMGAAVPVETKNLDQVASGKRMRKSAAPQDFPVEIRRDPVPKRVRRQPSVIAVSGAQNNES